MDSNTGYTVTPSVSYSETGEEIIDYDNAFLSTGNNLHHEDYQADIRFNPSTGEQALGIEPSFDYDPDDPEHQRTGDDMLWESVHEVYPDLDDAVQFAAHFYEGDQIDAFNRAVDIGDWDTIMPFLETMMADYHEHGQSMQGEEFVEDDQDYDPDEYVESEIFTEGQLDELVGDVSQEYVESVVDDLTVMEPGGLDLSYDYAVAAGQTDVPIYRDIYQAAANFHDGTASAEEMIAELQTIYSDQELVAAYRLIENI